ncbi:hypothetical protein DYH10_01550 [Candidatus Saccharibacteria bacterium CPR2]|nr:hypothetical protein [Candidatus Saccharibacteria bacterium CPR2]
MKKAKDEDGIIKGSAKTSIFRLKSLPKSSKIKSQEDKDVKIQPKQNSRKNKSKANPKQTVYKLIFSVLLVAILITVFLVILNSQKPQPSHVTDAYIYEENFRDARSLSISGKYSEAEEKISYMLSKENDANRKKELLSLLGANQANNKEYDKAIESYRQVEQLEVTPSYATLSSIAKTAELSGNKDLAIQYYGKVIDQLDTNSSMYLEEKAYYEDKIKELQQ